MPFDLMVQSFLAQVSSLSSMANDFTIMYLDILCITRESKQKFRTFDESIFRLEPKFHSNPDKIEAVREQIHWQGQRTMPKGISMQLVFYL